MPMARMTKIRLQCNLIKLNAETRGGVDVLLYLCHTEHGKGTCNLGGWGWGMRFGLSSDFTVLSRRLATLV